MVTVAAVVVSFVLAFQAHDLQAGLIRVLAGIVGAVVVWIVHVVFIGLVGVLFEIEKNTRAMRLERDGDEN